MPEIRDKTRNKIIKQCADVIDPECHNSYPVMAEILADQILSISELAIVDRSAELPTVRELSDGFDTAHQISYRYCQQAMIKAGYVLEVKNET